MTKPFIFNSLVVLAAIAALCLLAWFCVDVLGFTL